MKAQIKRNTANNPKASQKSKNKNFDYNKPVGKCMICYTLSGWHCYDCGNDYCQSHFHTHKEKNQCLQV
jgi:hypothetical protein